MTTTLQRRGRAWRISGPDGRLIPNVDTDQIFHNAHLAITERSQMAPFAFGNLEGWEDFPTRVQAGDMLLVGPNFGSGSSRQQAVDCFLALGVSAIVGVSFAAIYQRNAVNAALPLVLFPGLEEAPVATGDEVELDLATGSLRNLTSGDEVSGVRPLSQVQLDILQAGDLFAFAKNS